MDHLNLYILFKKSRTTNEVPDDRIKANIIPIYIEVKRESKEIHTSQPDINSWEVCRADHKVICNHIENNMVIIRSQHGFIKNNAY